MPKRGPHLSPAERIKIAQKLQVILNGDSIVNTLRAEQCAQLAVKNDDLLRRIPMQRRPEAETRLLSDLPRKDFRGKMKRFSGDVEANVFVELARATDKLPSWADGLPRRRGVIIGKFTPAEIRKVADAPQVRYIEVGQTLAVPQPILGADSTAEPDPEERRVSYGEADHQYGKKNVLVGIIDVGGFDFAHPDFLDASGHTRFYRIWDQGGSGRPAPSRPFDFGAEFKKKEHLDRAIGEASRIGVRPEDVERQSQMYEGSHATHVASIMAGNRGICRNAMIAGVLIAIPREDEERRKSFYDSTRLALAADYLLNLGLELNLPVIINVSLGTNGHAHDGSAAINTWIDAALSMPGRAVCVAAGNAGQEAAASPDDIGYVMGRVHTSGRVPANGLVADIEWTVVGNGIKDVSENELEIWYAPQDRFAVSLRSPGGEWIGPVEPGQYYENQKVTVGTAKGTIVSIYNQLYHRANGANLLALYLSPYFTSAGVVGVGAGRWTVRLHGRDVRDGTFHGWIERDDPRPVGPVGERQAWNFPSFFGEASMVDDRTISSLGCGNKVIAVANMDGGKERIHITSSQGPTRDGRQKPDVAAPGTGVVAASGFTGADVRWTAKTGTSMASPYIAGVVGLMLSMDRGLTAAQIIGIIHRTARPLPGSDYQWRNDAGFGAIDAARCVEEASSVNDLKDRRP